MRSWLKTMALLAAITGSVTVLAACDDDGNGAESDVDAGDEVELDGDDEPALPRRLGSPRSAEVFYPSDYDAERAYPLVTLLHGYGVNGTVQDLIFGLKQRVDEYGFVLIIPNGTVNDEGRRFWNAMPVCCNFEDEEVDDVAYLTSLMDEAIEVFNIDQERIGFVGQSNGGYMSYRMACERSSYVDRVVSLAGSVFVDAEDCVDDAAMSVLHIHGTLDDTVPYDNNIEADEGGSGHGIRTVGAVETVARWRQRAGCEPQPDVEGTLDLVSTIEGEETNNQLWTSCSSGERVQFWSVEEGDHILAAATDTFRDGIAEFLTRAAQ